MINPGDKPDMKLYKLSKLPPLDTNMYRYHREFSKCQGVFRYSIGRPLICPGCNGHCQGNLLTRTRRRLRDWLLQP